MQNKLSLTDISAADEAIHELWLIYCQLKDAEENKLGHNALLTSAREQLGLLINRLTR